MLILVTYDVNTQDAAGRRRLRQVAKKCVAHGQRVQNSVFECVIDNAQFLKLKQELKDIVDQETDSLRFYVLGNRYNSRVEHYGAKPSYDAEGVLFL
jgi:CRISPR-associated protein Cas2